MSRLFERTLSNGLHVLYQQDPTFPLASAALLFSAGSRRETTREAGLSSMSVDLMMQGTRKRDAKEIARVMESIGASMGTQAHEDYAEMGFVVPAAEVSKALHMMTEVLREPAFPEHEIKKERAHILAGLESRRDAIFHLAYDHFSESLYGDHAYGRPLEGNAKTVRRFKRADFRRWNQSHNSPEGAILSIVAPHPPKFLFALLEKSVAAWKSTSSRGGNYKPLALVTPLKKSHKQEVTSVFEQAYLMTGWQAPSAHHEDHLTLKVLNTLLGGGMSSRLFVTLREELGLAYEVSSFYPTRLDKSQWVIYLGLPAQKLPLASRRLEELLEKLAHKGPEEREMHQSRAMIRGAFLMDRQSRRRQGWYNAWWKFLGRGPDYSHEFLNSIDAITGTHVRDLLRKFLDQPRVTVRVLPK